MAELVAITGTDTGIGKTWVGCRLAEALRGAGREVRAIKLVETGTGAAPDAGEDGPQLAHAAGQVGPRAALRRYRMAVTPADAAEAEGRRFDLAATWDEALELAAASEITLFEGAGGVMAPLDWGESLLDLLARHRVPTLVVAADRLGTLNHTLLTLEVLASRSVPTVGVVINPLPTTRDDASRGRNAAALRRARPALRVAETDTPDWAVAVCGWLRA